MAFSVTGVSMGGGLPASGASAAASSAGGFRRLFENAVNQVESFRAGAEQSAERFLRGESEELHQTALAVQRAELAFDLFLQVRNKVVQAYQEIMRMQV